MLSSAGWDKNIIPVDECPPLSLPVIEAARAIETVPDAHMLAWIHSAMALLELLAQESGNVWRMNRLGYF